MEEDGRFSPNEESVEEDLGRVCDILVENGYTWMATGSADEMDWWHMQYLRGLVYTSDRATNKADPKCLRPIKIAASRKYIMSSDVAENAASQDSKDDFTSGRILGKLGGTVRGKGGSSRTSTSPTVISGVESPIRLETCL